MLPRRFNGAAALRPRKRQLLSVIHRAVFPLQWGRGFEAAETLSEGVSEVAIFSASMGPRL